MGFNPFRQLMRDTVTLVKPDGTRVEGIQAKVGRDRILVTDASLPIEEGDRIERERPGGILERYTVLDTGYSEALHSIPAHFSLEVRKETSIPRNPPSPTSNYYLTGPNSRVNTNSVDASLNIAVTRAPQLFADLRASLTEVANVEQRTQLLAIVDEMESTQGSSGFLARYQAFMQAAANHMTIVGPFLPALSQLLG